MLADREASPESARWRVALFAVALTLGVLAFGCIVWGLLSAFARPPDYPEGCILFNAHRMREGLSLYVDPTVGAHEYGEPPARYFVAYTPIAAKWLAILPTAHALGIARVVCLCAWVFALARIVLTSQRGCRQAATLAALFVASTFVFALWASSARPDAIALLLASFAFTRALDRGHADAKSGVLFGLAALVKQSVIGMALGTLAATVILSRGRQWRGPAAAAAVIVLGLAGLEIASGGVALSHMSAALGLAFDRDLLIRNVTARAPFVAGLLASAIVASLGSRQRCSLALAVIFSTVITACIGLGKVGGASNYAMEPSIACVVVLSRLPLARAGSRVAEWGFGFLVVLSLAWSGTATIRSLVEEPVLYQQRRIALANIRSRCVDHRGDFVMSTEPGVEMEINGRLHAHHVELWNASRLGRFPSAVWAKDVQHSNVRCVVTWTGTDSPPPTPRGLFPEDVARVMHDEFPLAQVHAGYALYVRRSP